MVLFQAIRLAEHREGAEMTQRYKKAAGALLDGREHKEVPE